MNLQIGLDSVIAEYIQQLKELCAWLLDPVGFFVCFFKVHIIKEIVIYLRFEHREVCTNAVLSDLCCQLGNGGCHLTESRQSLLKFTFTRLT